MPGLLVDCTTNEAQLHLKMLQLFSLMTSPQQELFVDIMKTVVNDKSLFTNTRIPTSMVDVRKMYLQGQFIIQKALPQAPVIIVHEHAYVKIYDVISHIVVHGL